LIIRQRDRSDIITGISIVLLLVIVMVTPSKDAFHRYSSYVLFLLLMGYYTWVLLRWNSRYVIVHLAVLLLLTVLTAWHSYGLWQKALVLYMLVLMNMHGLFLYISMKRHALEFIPSK
jgi:hypothetical protein